MARLSQSHVAAILARNTPGAQVIPPIKRRSKYGAVKTTVNGITFDSKREAARYSQLCLMVRAGKISDLQLQTKFPIYINSGVLCIYVCDFDYRRDGQRVIEDVKGVKTPVYRMKKKAMKLYYGIEIQEIK